MNPPSRWSPLTAALTCIAMGFLANRTAAEIPPHPSYIEYRETSFRTPEPSSRRIELAKGVTAFVETDHLLPLLEVTLAFDAGSRHDPPGRTGLALLTGALLTRGGSAKLEPAEFDARLEAMGANLDTVVRGRRAIARLSAPAWAATEALDLFFDLMSGPRFDERMLDIVRRTAIEELERRNEDPLDVLEREWTWLLFGRDHSAGRAPSPASFNAIARSDLSGFYSCFWRPGRMVAALSGDLSDTALAQIENRVSAWQAQFGPGESERPGSECPDAGGGASDPSRGSSPVGTSGLHAAFHPAPQAKILVGHRLHELPGWTDRERFALLVAREVLGGGGAISRLNGRLRTAEGIAYRASANLVLDVAGETEFRMFLETRADRAWSAIDLVLEEVDRLRRELVHPRELEVVRETLIGVLRSEFDTAEEVVGYLAENALLSRPLDYWQSYLEAVRTIDRSEVRAAAQKYFRPENFTVLVVGPQRDLFETPEAADLRAPSGVKVSILPPRDPGTLESNTPTAPSTDDR